MTGKRKSPPPPLTLREIQDRLQAAILTSDDAILDTILDNSRTSRETLFGVYRNAYVGRLVDVLKSDYALLRSYVGDDTFGGFARAYISAHPSRTQNARWFGAKLPEFLATSKWNDEHPRLAEIAQIEKAVSDAFDATDAPVLGVENLVKFPPESWGRLAFVPHPSAARFDAATNAFAIWRALKDDETPPEAATRDAPDHLIVWRQDATPRVRAMSDEETMMWTEACRGVRFEVLCEMAATYDDPENAAGRAAGYLQGWLSSHLLTSASLVEIKKPRKTSTAFDRPAPRKSAAAERGGA